jgi:hypothetical protein
LAAKSITGGHLSHHGEVIGGKVLLESIEWNISTHEYVHYELEFDLNNLHFLYEEEIWKLMVPNIFEDVEEETLVVR